MPLLEADGVQLYYHVHGLGSAIVFIHGASWDHRQRDPQVEAFGQDFQVVVWDVRGHGRSTLPAGRVDPDTFRHDIVALLDHLVLPRAILCGLSMGGHISLQAAARNPDRVTALNRIGSPFANRYDWYETFHRQPYLHPIWGTAADPAPDHPPTGPVDRGPATERPL